MESLYNLINYSLYQTLMHNFDTPLLKLGTYNNKLQTYFDTTLCH